MSVHHDDLTRYLRRRHSVSKLVVHLIFTTKYRRKLLDGTMIQGESVNILLNFTQFFETRIEYRFQIFTAHSCDFLLPSYARLA